ncbi:hypothetical protein GCM10009106_03060 [Sphingomonas japonica]
MQRVRVGVTGLASVVLLIGVAAAVWSSASREAPVTAVGASNSAVVANITSPIDATGDAAAVETEPLAELGAAPSTASTEEVNAADIERALNIYDEAVPPAPPPR